jgi:Zn-dependent M28 family amino/carboxypeptidase
MVKNKPLAQNYAAMIILCGLMHSSGWAKEQGKIDSQSFRDAITVEGIRAHQQALQDIAQRNGKNRMAVTDGYKASVSYVQERLESAGYDVRRQDFFVNLSEDKNPPQLIQKSPVEQVFIAGVDFLSMSSQGTVQIEAELEAVDLLIPSLHANHSTSGCETEDFSNFKSGNIALIQRGSCPFQEKVENAVKAGASGVIIFNEGNPEREGAIESRLSTAPINYPILGASFAVGNALRGSTIHGPTGNIVVLAIDVVMTANRVQNVIAETKEGDGTKVVVIGAHLDSVFEGPGMNDNGSGSATILEIANKYAELKITPKNKLRFIWFGAEEFGLLGSEYYVSSLTTQEKKQIMAMLNFDMLGSSNYARFVYDGGNSSLLKDLAGGSGYIERIFLDYFSSISLPTHPTAFDGRSDYGPFIEVGIPAGGLFSGAEGRKSQELARVYGGVAGKAFDPCYHRACDDFAHTGDQNGSLALKSLDELSDAAAHAVVHLAATDIPVSLRKGGEKYQFDFEYRGNLLIK